MIVPDVNLILYANFAHFPAHGPARSWWLDALNGTDTVGIGFPVLFGVLRISTNPRIFRQPFPVADAIALAESWFRRPTVILLHPGPRHLEIAFELLRRSGSGGDLTTDVQLAALAIENQAQLHSADADFGRFPGLRWVNPLQRR